MYDGEPGPESEASVAHTQKPLNLGNLESNLDKRNSGEAVLRQNGRK